MTGISEKNFLDSTPSRLFRQNSSSPEMLVHAVDNPSEKYKIGAFSTEIENWTSRSQDLETSKSEVPTLNEQLQMKAEEWLDSLVWCTKDDAIGIFLIDTFKKN